MKTLFALLTTALLTVSAAQATDASDPSKWPKDDKKEICTDMQQRARAYLRGGYTGDDIVVTYCNMGGYVVKRVKLKITRQSDNAVIYNKSRKQNLTREWGHFFRVSAGGIGNNNETYKMELSYKIATASKKPTGGDRTRTCKRSFTYKANKDTLWMVKSEGTKWGGSGCKNIKFEQK